MPIFRKIKINMRSSLLDTVLRSYISEPAPSRTSVSQNCSVSKVSAGKVASALIDSGFMCERLFTLKRGERPRRHLFPEDHVRFLLVDLSTHRFKMSVISANMETVFETVHIYDSSIYLDENLNIFFSRGGLMIKNSGYSISAISVLYADEAQIPFIETQFSTANLPSIKYKDVISKEIYSIFRKDPDVHLTVSDAISESLKFSTSDTSFSGGASYIYVGNKLLAFHSYHDSSKAVCSPHNLLSEKEKFALCRPQPLTKEEVDDFLIKLCEFMNAAFNPTLIIMESDVHAPDDITARKINRAFTLSGITAPLLMSRSASNPFYLQGIIKLTLYNLIKRYISGI